MKMILTSIYKLKWGFISQVDMPSVHSSTMTVKNSCYNLNFPACCKSHCFLFCINFSDEITENWSGITDSILFSSSYSVVKLLQKDNCLLKNKGNCSSAYSLDFSVTNFWEPKFWIISTSREYAIIFVATHSSISSTASLIKVIEVRLKVISRSWLMCLKV